MRTRPLIHGGIAFTMQHICLACCFVDSPVDPLETVIKIAQAQSRADKQSNCEYQGYISKQLHHALSGCVGPHSTPIEDDQSAEEVCDKAYVAHLGCGLASIDGSILSGVRTMTGTMPRITSCWTK